MCKWILTIIIIRKNTARIHNQFARDQSLKFERNMQQFCEKSTFINNKFFPKNIEKIHKQTCIQEWIEGKIPQIFLIFQWYWLAILKKWKFNKINDFITYFASWNHQNFSGGSAKKSLKNKSCFFWLKFAFKKTFWFLLKLKLFSFPFIMRTGTILDFSKNCKINAFDQKFWFCYKK